MEKDKNSIALKEKDISLDVLSRITKLQECGEISLPEKYNPANALKGAWLYLQDVKDKAGNPALKICTDVSIATSLFKMVIKGLSVVKGQCYLLVYGTELICQDSYFGNYTRAKRECGVIDVNGQVVFEGDKSGFKYETDLDTSNIKILAHPQKIENIDMNKIVGVYATVIFSDGRKKTVVMSMKQVRENWMFGHAKGNSLAHKRTPDQMAIRTAINRALKIELNSSDDQHLKEKERADKSETVDIETIEIEQPKQEVEDKKPVEEKSRQENPKQETQTPKF